MQGKYALGLIQTHTVDKDILVDYLKKKAFSASDTKGDSINLVKIMESRMRRSLRQQRTGGLGVQMGSCWCCGRGGGSIPQM